MRCCRMGQQLCWLVSVFVRLHAINEIVSTLEDDLRYVKQQPQARSTND